jgi:putative protein-disulfide isomerase
MNQLIYVGDPMCSWCYGFGPELAALLKAIPNVKLDFIMGGLRAGGKDRVTPEFRDFIHGHWAQVQQASGMPFNFDAIEHPGFVYDTEPVCRAFVSALMLHPELPSMAQLALFAALQQAFYGKGQDVTQGEVLAQVCCQALARLQHPTEVAKFLEFWQSQPARAQTNAHFEQAANWGITGFPSLLVVQNERLFLLSSGYAKTAVLLEHFHKIQAQV